MDTQQDTESYESLKAEVEKLREEHKALSQWKKEAVEVLVNWSKAWEPAGIPGNIGDSMQEATKEYKSDLLIPLPDGSWIRQSAVTGIIIIPEGYGYKPRVTLHHSLGDRTFPAKDNDEAKKMARELAELVERK